MAQKRKKNQSKLDRADALLQKLEEKTARAVKPRLGDNWRDNLFEILMTRLELAKPQKKLYAAIPSDIRDEPAAIPHFAQRYLKTMKRMLTLAKAPASPLHVAGFGVLYATVVHVFLNDDTRDNARTMAALDRRLSLFEQFTNSIPCK